MVVGSSWERDEDVYIPWLHRHPDCRAVIAPHEFDKNRLSVLRRRLGSDKTMLYSDFCRIYDASPEGALKVASQLSYIIMDCFGLLSSLYRYAAFAYVGGGFGKSHTQHQRSRRVWYPRGIRPAPQQVQRSRKPH